MGTRRPSGAEGPSRVDRPVKAWRSRGPENPRGGPGRAARARSTSAGAGRAGMMSGGAEGGPAPAGGARCARGPAHACRPDGDGTGGKHGRRHGSSYSVNPPATAVRRGRRLPIMVPERVKPERSLGENPTRRRRRSGRVAWSCGGLNLAWHRPQARRSFAERPGATPSPARDEDDARELRERRLTIREQGADDAGNRNEDCVHRPVCRGVRVTTPCRSISTLSIA